MDAKQIEAVARDLCKAAGHGTENQDMLVSFSQAWEIRTPRGTAFGGQVENAAPLWTAWIHEAALVIQMADSLSRERLK